MAKQEKHNPKSRQKPSCATCLHYQAENEQGGICFGVQPVALFKPHVAVSSRMVTEQDYQLVGAFPPVKPTSRCPNWLRDGKA